ncbi:hypothetical protein D4R86_02915 [bacterium]|nr:MAG: hypothetical protein D4R86_02915 [bacterium]
MTEETSQGEAAPVQTLAEPENNVSQANTIASTTNDPMIAGLQQSVNIAGVADKGEKVYGEKTAPVAAPLQQIAPVSANGEQTSARESPKAEIPLVSQPAGVSSNINPSAEESAQPPVQETPVPTSEEAPEAETSAEETLAEETPAEETPAEETPAEEATTEETPAEEATTEETPVDEIPEGAAPEEAPLETPVEAPAEKSAEEAPQEEPEVTFDDLSPLQQADNLLQQVPGRFRLQ